jgi:glutamate/tyrosine decarboxylase-like PLP-dependent enzyme
MPSARGCRINRSVWDSHPAWDIWSVYQPKHPTLRFGLGDLISNALDLAALAQRLIEQDLELELLCPTTLGVVCFRRRFAGVGDDEAERERANVELVAAFESSGRGLVSSTRLHGRYAIRMCVMNHTTTRADVEQTLRWLASGPLRVDRRLERRTWTRLPAVCPAPLTAAAPL